MNNNDFVTQKQMGEYSDYLKEETEKTKTILMESIKSGQVDPDQIRKLSESYDTLMEQQTKVSQYLNYLASSIQIVVEENKSLKKITEKIKNFLNIDVFFKNLSRKLKLLLFFSPQESGTSLFTL